ncbi:alpha-D-ribose 1-methylphosphonate 5-triphosphate diphosphatase [Tamaricihabitans halophyticus]|uniref:Alpha-D-ribose 1-methylphosphonate 5-triphosphate diphosphatase n=1 Tax=Tamaricihabitans halophyticus TaxID=1262583 RepID=A0A4R2QX95_9PSEU|nr:alpha-D-ribose 1-methylphosphonate 5-triphosphate diphosphatase [Tamaricihabitans halophyticus]TCP53608.1 alpha-D-ribose 1-methylphosphonate 5-triphosphate diphosphatase [Tamaricihabitans halophyticus]
MTAGILERVGEGGWTLAGAPRNFVLGHVRAVLPDRVLDDARIVVRDGLIAAVEPHTPGTLSDVDGQGMLCLPGLVDVHSDGLEKERLPRPGAELPIEFALVSFEGKLRAAGVTTVFHGAGFEDGMAGGLRRSVRAAEETCAAIDNHTHALVAHHILYRLDVRCPTGLAALRRRLDTVSGVPLVSHEDHTPGQGQYADRRYFERYLMGTRGYAEEEAKQQVDAMIEKRNERLSVRTEALDWVGELAQAGQIRLLGHDPDSAAEISALCTRGGAVAEFPTTREAAIAAREHGLPVVMGAPNVLRGGSHNGNASGQELIAENLVTALASDYLPSGLLAAAFDLVRFGELDVPSAIRLVTEGAAEVAGLTDRGALAEGLRADLVLVSLSGQWPAVRSVLPAAVPERSTR